MGHLLEAGEDLDVSCTPEVAHKMNIFAALVYQPNGTVGLTNLCMAHTDNHLR